MQQQRQVTTTSLRFVDEANSNDFTQQQSNGTQGQFTTTSTNGYGYTSIQGNSNSNNHNSKSNTIVRSSFQQQHSPNNLRSSLNSLDSSASNSLMPINVKGMILNGVASDEVLRGWLISIKCDEYLRNFIDHGYDMHLLSRMTPQDLTAIGCKSPNLRKKLLMEIKKLNLDDDIPNFRPNDLAQWLSQLKLSDYYGQLCREGYDNVEKVCQLTWEDLEEIGISKLGHQKRLLLGIERLQKQSKQSEDTLRGDYAIYDVHPNHRISLHPGMSDKRLSRSTVRSGFFTTKSGNLDNRGVPVATVLPALKHVTNSLGNLDLSQQTITNVECLNGNNQKIYSIDNDRTSTAGSPRKSPQNSGASPNHEPSHSHQQEQQTMNMSDFSSNMGTMRRPPPLPPVRTNSLKITPDQLANQQFDNNNIYDNTYGASYGDKISNTNNGGGTTATMMGYNTMTSSSTGFLRTPKLGTLTATTNKMLSHGGHIQTISTQVPVIKSVPIREAPHPPQVPPPMPPPPPPPGPHPPANTAGPLLNKVDPSMDPLMDSSQVGHQLASANEFPPPPPPQ